MSSGALPEFVEPLGDGLFAIDTGFQRPRLCAAYLLVHGGRAAFIDTGTNHSVHRLLKGLSAVGLGPEAVDWVIPTHVHLDHAGGAGALMQHLPRARLLVHPRGLRHMVDPSKLMQGALAVYGAHEVERSYGQLIPVPAERAQASHDGQQLDLGGRLLELIDTPGHARHHHCIWDSASRSWFTGDTFGLSYREFDNANGAWITPTIPPGLFEPDALKASIQRLLARQPEGICLTHYSRVRDVARLGAQLLQQLDDLVALGQAEHRREPSPERHQRLKHGLEALLRQRLAAHGVADVDAMMPLLAGDIELNAQGLGEWLARGAPRGL